MSPNCWASIEDAARARPGCRYLEWGSGNSTIAMLRAVLGDPNRAASSIVSVESSRSFAQEVIDGVASAFRDASVDGTVRVEPLHFPRPSLVAALRRDPTETRLEAHFLKALWLGRTDRFWISNAPPASSARHRTTGVRRRLTTLRCAAAYRWHRMRRALARPVPAAPSSDAGTVQAPMIRDVRPPMRVTFSSDRVELELFVVPQLRSRLSRKEAILDGLYIQFADYVSVPLEGQFDVIVVDGRARTSCLKRVHHEGLLAPGGVLFVHDAHRHPQQEGLQLFRPWSFVRGSERLPDERSGAPGRTEVALEPPLVRSGSSMRTVERVLDRELFFYEAPAEPPSP
jgi:hypothetical protein